MSAELLNLSGKLQDQDGEINENGNVPLFNKDSIENAPVKDGRVIKKAKRLGKPSPRKEDDHMNGMTFPQIHANQGKKPLPFSKNSRKSRNSRGRGLPKGLEGCNIRVMIKVKFYHVTLIHDLCYLYSTN